MYEWICGIREETKNEWEAYLQSSIHPLHERPPSLRHPDQVRVGGKRVEFRHGAQHEPSRVLLDLLLIRHPCGNLAKGKRK